MRAVARLSDAKEDTTLEAAIDKLTKHQRQMLDAHCAVRLSGDNGAVVSFATINRRAGYEMPQTALQGAIAFGLITVAGGGYI